MNIVQYFSDALVDFINYSITQLIEPDNNIDLTAIMIDAEKLLQSMFCSIIEEVTTEADELLYSKAKESNDFVIKEKARKRTLITPFGNIELCRRYYQCKSTGQFHYLLDELIGLPRYSRVDGSCQIKLINAVKDHSYAAAAQIVTPSSMSRQTVLNYVHKLDYIPDTLEEKIEPISVDEIFIEADEDHVAMQDGSNKQMRLASIYTNKEAVCADRVKLVDKHSFTGLETADQFWQHIDTYCADHFNGTPKVTIIGDGAAWIKKGLEYLPNSRFVLDRFHLNKYIRKICGNSGFTELVNYIREDDYEGFMKLATSYIKKSSERANTVKIGIRYIRNQWAAARMTLLKTNIHSSTEAHVSHILSHRLSSRPMGWSRTGAENIAKLRVLHDNGESISEYMKQWLNGQIHRRKHSISVENILSAATSELEIKRKLKPYTTYIPLNAAKIPGAESAHNRWLQAFKNRGFEKLM